MQRHRHHRARLQIHRVLSLVRHMRAAVLHLRDACVGVVRMLSILIGRRVLTLLIDLRQLLARRRLDPRFQSQTSSTRIFDLMFDIPTFQRPSASLFIGLEPDEDAMEANTQWVKKKLSHSS